MVRVRQASRTCGATLHGIADDEESEGLGISKHYKDTANETAKMARSLVVSELLRLSFGWGLFHESTDDYTFSLSILRVVISKSRGTRFEMAEHMLFRTLTDGGIHRRSTQNGMIGDLICFIGKRR